MSDRFDKRSLSERDICTKYITPSIVGAGWNVQTQIREEVTFTKGRVNPKGRLVSRGESKRADYILYFKPNIPLAIVEAKDNKHGIGDGMQQALNYAEIMEIPFVYSSNGDAFLEHDRTGTSAQVEREFSLNEFPSPEQLLKTGFITKRISIAQLFLNDGSSLLPSVLLIFCRKVAILT